MKLDNTNLWVRDLDEALAFYRDVLGFEVREDVTVGSFRWLSVALPGHGTGLVLGLIPGEPIMDRDTRDKVEEIMSKGFAGTLFMVTDDIRADYDRLTARGVEFHHAPNEEIYGIDTSFRDPSGNHIRLTQPKQVAGTPEELAAMATPVGCGPTDDD